MTGEVARSGVRAVLQATTWSSSVSRAVALWSPGLNVAKFSNSVRSDRVTCGGTSAISRWRVEHRGDGVVVLRGDHHEPVERGDDVGPGRGVLVLMPTR